MNQNDELIRGTRLEKAVLYIAKAQINLLTLVRLKPDSVLMDFQISRALLTHDIGPNHQVVKLLLAARLRHVQGFKRTA